MAKLLPAGLWAPCICGLWLLWPLTACGLLQWFLFLWPSAQHPTATSPVLGTSQEHRLPGCCIQRHIPLPIPSCSLPMPGHGSSRLCWAALPLPHAFPQLLAASQMESGRAGPSSGLECGCLPWWPLHSVGTAESPYVSCLLVVRGGRGFLEWASAPSLLCLQLLTHSSAEEQGRHHPCAATTTSALHWWTRWSSWLGLELVCHGSTCFSMSGRAAGTAISSEM